MHAAVSDKKPFQPGTTGWTAADLDDPAVERLWFAGRYEIVEGVLTIMPPAYFVGGHALANLLYVLTAHTRGLGLGYHFATEVDVVIDEPRVARIDAVMLTPADRTRQMAAVKAAGRADPERTRILIPPTLAIEVISPGHESHDRRTKRGWYADFGVPHYWILDPFQRSLQSLVLGSNGYQDVGTGRGGDEVRFAPFPGLPLSLSQLWQA